MTAFSKEIQVMRERTLRSGSIDQEVHCRFMILNTTMMMILSPQCALEILMQVGSFEVDIHLLGWKIDILIFEYVDRTLF